MKNLFFKMDQADQADQADQVDQADRIKDSIDSFILKQKQEYAIFVIKTLKNSLNINCENFIFKNDLKD